VNEVPKKLVLFGTGQIAELAAFYFTHDSAYEVAAFTVDSAFIQANEFLGLPVVPFEEVSAKFSPQDFGMFIALSYTKLNRLRAEKLDTAITMGYRAPSYVSSRATTFPGFSPGENAFILEDNTIQPFASIGRNVTLWSGNHIGHHASIGDHCFVTSHVVVSGGVSVGPYSFLGVNATIRNNVRIGARCLIGAGALVLADAHDESVFGPEATLAAKVPSSRIRNI
jgi:sugar O-acyltransferase (sialic acid O-acetyltransferase NeuD family)